MPFHHILIALIVSIVWGVNFVVMKIGLAHLSPFLFVTLRFGIVLLLLFPWLRPVKGHMWLLAGIGLCLGGLHFAFAITGLQLTQNVSAIIIIVQLHVPLTLIMAHFILKERLSYWRTAGVVIAFLGVVIISFDPAIVNERIAIIVIFIATMFYSLGAILMRKLRNVAVFNTQAWTALFGLPVLMTLTLMTESGQLAQVMSMNMNGWWALLYTAVLSSVVGYGGMNFLLRKYPVTMIAPIFLSTPVFATAAAVMVFDEVLTMRFLAGAGLTLAGLVLIHVRDWLKGRQVVRELLP